MERRQFRGRPAVAGHAIRRLPLHRGVQPDPACSRCAADPAAQVSAALVATLLYTGARVSELLGAYVEDLGADRGHRVLGVRRKGGKIQALDLPAPAAGGARSLEGVTELSGTWRSVYEYPSSSRGGTFASEHEVTLTQDGNTVRVRSFDSPSRIMIDLHALEVEDRVVLTGEWTEVTDPAGPYEGRRYHGGIQMLLSEDGHTMSGRWVGHNRALTEINAGTWQLERISEGD